MSEMEIVGWVCIVATGLLTGMSATSAKDFVIKFIIMNTAILGGALT